MIAQTPRDPWRAIWQVATSDHLAAAVLLGIAAGLIITAWLPQTPVNDPVAYARWLSRAQARFGDATPTMRTLGLFLVSRSFVFRTLLALLAGMLLLRLIEAGDRLWQNREIATPEGEWHDLPGIRLSDVMHDLHRWRHRILGKPPLVQADRWPWADMFPLLAYGGGLLFLIGLLITHLWGWQIDGLIVQSGERVTLPRTDAWVMWNETTQAVTHSPGIATHIEEQVPGVKARAQDNTGRPLSLQQTPEVEPVAQLTLALADVQYFAIPDAQLVVRMVPPSNRPIDPVSEADNPILVQIYRSPPGRLAAETVVEQAAQLSIDDVTLELTDVPYARLTVICNPGLWPTGVGLTLLVVGLLGSIVWPVRQLWLREDMEQLQVTGDPLPTLTTGEEA